MSDHKTLKAVDRKIFTSYFQDGLLDIFLAAFVLMFAVGPFLSGPLGDFWGTVIFLPFFGLVYLILRYIRKRVVSPRIGSVTWGEMRVNNRNFTDAKETLDECLTIAENLNEKYDTATAFFGLGKVEEANGNIPKARKLGEKSYAIYEEIGSHRAKEVEDWLSQLGD